MSSLTGHTNLGAEGKLISGSVDTTIRVWSVQQPACENVLQGHTDWVRACPDRRKLRHYTPSPSPATYARTCNASGQVHALLGAHSRDRFRRPYHPHLGLDGGLFPSFPLWPGTPAIPILPPFHHLFSLLLCIFSSMPPMTSCSPSS